MKSGILLAVFISFFSITESRASGQHGDVDRYYNHYNNPNSYYHNKNIGNEILYQIVVDRFANGNKSNDCIHKGRYCAHSKMRALDKWYAYQGGDLRGVIKAVPYLKDLGVTRLWLTPIFENNHVHAPSMRGNGAVTSYHGYWINDWYHLNPYFTDKGVRDYNIVNELIRTAGSDLRIYLDTVANHTSPADATPESLDYLNKINPIDLPGIQYPHRGALFKAGKFLTSLDVELEKFKRDPSYNPLFHPWDKAISDWNNPWEVENLQLARLADFNQNNSALLQYLEDAHDFWLKTFPGLAGYRIDTIKHVPQGYWNHFSKELFQKFPKVEGFGEYWDAGTWNASSHDFYNQTRFSMLDFNTRTALEKIFGRENAPMHILTSMWQKDGALGDARSLITFVDNHDLPRLRATGLPYVRMQQAVATWMVSRGIPVVYYGLEQDLFHQGPTVGDPFNRPMMQFNKNPEMHRFMKTLIHLRKKNLALRYGATHVVHETPHILAFERIYKGQVVFFATSTNSTPNGPNQFFVDDLKMPDGNYRDILNGRVYKIENGRIPLSLSNGEMVLLTNAF